MVHSWSLTGRALHFAENTKTLFGFDLDVMTDPVEGRPVGPSPLATRPGRWISSWYVMSRCVDGRHAYDVYVNTSVDAMGISLVDLTTRLTLSQTRPAAHPPIPLGGGDLVLVCHRPPR